MTKRKKYYLIGFILLTGVIIGYHFLAASQAEDQIDNAIQQQSEETETISVQYSSIDVSPFSATVTIRDLTLILGNHIERAQHLQLNMSYIDFLNIYFGGLSYGLEHLNRADIQLIKPSYVNKMGLQEIKLDTLNITYSGNALDGLHSSINGTPFGSDQSIEAQSNGLTISLPQTTVSTIKAESFQYSGAISSGNQNFWTNGSHQFRMDSLTWTPSKSFQDKYSFFIKGFGYPTNAIPFTYVQLHTSATEDPDLLKIESSIKSELALLTGSGFLKLSTPLTSSAFQKTNISLTNYSNSFRTVLNNIEHLLSINLPQKEEGVSLQITGPVSNPAITQ
jgi:hypothetical protein